MTTKQQLQTALAAWRKKECTQACAAQCRAARRHVTRYNAVGRLSGAETSRLYSLAMRGQWPAIGAV